MKYYIEFKPVVYLYNNPAVNLYDWNRWREIDCQNSPQAVLIEIIQRCKLRSHRSFKKIDKNLYEYISHVRATYHLRIQLEVNNNNVICDFDCLDWIPIGEEITIEKLNNKFMPLIDWNLGLLK